MIDKKQKNKSSAREELMHSVPTDVRKALTSDSEAKAAWDDLTPIARNEWICWVTFPKKVETRKEHAMRLIIELKEGKRRPCCWIGCIHRTDKSVSPSVQYILNTQQRNNRKL